MDRNIRYQKFPNEAIHGSISSGSRSASKEDTTFGTKIKNITLCLNIKQFWNLSCNFAFCIFIFAFSEEGFCDRLTLIEKAEGNEVEILEEREDSFIIRIPKGEIALIKRERPTEVELWHQKKILWEDTGDYISIYLPKEKIVLPEGYKGEKYDSAQVFIEEGLGSAAGQGRPEGVGFQATGSIKGRVMRHGEPVNGVKLKIVNVSRQTDIFGRIFGPKDAKPEDLIFEVTTNINGNYVFSSIPIGEYDIYWLDPRTNSWYRQLSEKPNITVRPGETLNHPDIEMR